MTPEVEAWIAELVEQAPPLTPEQQELIVRVFGPNATDELEDQ